ncbi:AI-2E family transporter [Variovorax sp. HJSM1_2]|uniref:AI-2E family transporter n=1 Tax=Variovorax sp. HJSM1_2 TaxID=3366263 RepID=UPI003BC6FC49
MPEILLRPNADTIDISFPARSKPSLAYFMQTTPQARRKAHENKIFVLLMVVVTLAFGWILLPFGGAVFWGVVMAILFAPLHRWLLRKLNGRATLAALCTLLIILVMVILPMGLIGGMLVRELTAIFAKLQSGSFNLGERIHQIESSLPQWLTDGLAYFEISGIKGLEEKLVQLLTQGGQIVLKQSLSVGQNTFEFAVSFCIMLYLLYFLLRDGDVLMRNMRAVVPLQDHTRRALMGKFITVVRATVKGNLLVAAAQGALGGLAFWGLGIPSAVLWSVLMAFLSLLPAVGAGLIWGPVAIYYLATGDTVKAVALAAYGVLVIGMVDNVLRPVLVGKDTKLPDYMVLLSTLGGMAIFGLNGFVIGPVIAALFLAVWGLYAASVNEPLEGVEADASPVAATPLQPLQPLPSQAGNQDKPRHD